MGGAYHLLGKKMREKTRVLKLRCLESRMHTVISRSVHRAAQTPRQNFLA